MRIFSRINLFFNSKDREQWILNDVISVEKRSFFRVEKMVESEIIKKATKNFRP